METRASVTAVIPTKNVASIICPTLESLRFCDEVVVVDMFSTDDTRAVCEEYSNVCFVERDDYIYGNFNHGAELARSEWIIRIDSDEVVSAELQQSILEVLKENPSDFVAYDAFCHLFFFGQRLRHGFGDKWRTMLFRKGAARYEVKSEHEGLTIANGRVGRLAGYYEHRTNPTISAWLSKINYYSDRDVERAPRDYFSRGRMMYRALRHFQRLYFRPGWLCRDGHLGLIVAGLAAGGLFIEDSKMWERSRIKEGEGQTICQNENSYQALNKIENEI